MPKYEVTWKEYYNCVVEAPDAPSAMSAALNSDGRADFYADTDDLAARELPPEEIGNYPVDVTAHKEDLSSEDPLE